MDIKDLSKSQLILLAVLLSFITSIATGITTVTLMQQAPVSFTTPINRIIKQTVEKIVPVPGNDVVQTVIVTEEDLVVDAIAKNQSAIFTVTKDFRDLENQLVEISVGQGFAVSSDGVVAVDALWAGNPESYYVSNSSGKFKASFLFTDKGVSFLKIGEPLDAKNTISYTVPTPGDLSKTKIGQKIIILGSTISSFIFDGALEIKISVPKSLAGGMVLNLNGEVLGIALSGETQSFVSITAILDSLKANGVAS